MKANLLTFSLIATAILGVTASCTDEAFGVSTAMDNSISVSAMVGSGTSTKVEKLPVSGETTQSDLASFSLTAWQASVATPIINGVTYTKNDTKFTPTGGPYYWPEGLVRFWAYADSNAVAQTRPSFSATRDSIVKTYSVHGIKQNDPIFAYVSQAKHPDDNNVSLSFQHMLSRVSINAYAPYFTEGYLRVVSFGFKNVRTGGTFVYVCQDNASTSSALDTALWRSPVTGNIGYVGSDTTSTSKWYKASSGDTTGVKAPVWKAGEGPVVKKTLQAYPAGGDANKSRLAYVDGGELKVQIPWLNVVPGVTVADSLFVTYEYYNPKSVIEGGHKWITKIARLSLKDITVPVPSGAVSGSKQAYFPGYQYIYNVRILGQETDDAEVQQAQIVVDGVTIAEWVSQGIVEVKTTDEGSGKNLKYIVENAPAFSTVTVKNGIDSISLKDAGTITVSKDMTIDLKECKIIAPDNGVVFHILAGKKVTIKGGSLKPGEIDTVTTKAGSVCLTDEPVAKNGAICVEGGATLYLEKSGEYATSVTTANDTMSCIFVKGAGAAVHVKAGNFLNTAENGKSVAKASGSTGDIVLNGEATFNGSGAIPEAVTPGEGTVISDIDGLISVATRTNSGIKLGANIAVDSTKIPTGEATAAIQVTKDLTIDMNGNDITSCYGRLFDVHQAKLTLKGTGTINTSESKAGTTYTAIRVYGSEEPTATGYGVAVDSLVAFNVKGYAVAVMPEPTKNVAYGIAVDIASKSFKTEYALLTVGGLITATEGNVPVVTIKGTAGKTLSDLSNELGLYLAGYAKTTVEAGAVFTCTNTGTEIRAGELTIKGGTFTSSYIPTEVDPSGSGTTTKGAAIAVAQHTTQLPIFVTIENGSFSGYHAFFQRNIQNNPQEAVDKIHLAVNGGTFSTINTTEQKATVYSENFTAAAGVGFITGGTYNSDPTAYVANGYVATETSGSWTVGPVPAPSNK